MSDRDRQLPASALPAPRIAGFIRSELTALRARPARPARPPLPAAEISTTRLEYASD
jgi:hypothetical protein